MYRSPRALSVVVKQEGGEVGAQREELKSQLAERDRELKEIEAQLWAAKKSDKEVSVCVHVGVCDHL